MYTVTSSIVLLEMHYVSFSDTCIHIYGHVGFCSLREAKFCGVPLRVFDKSGYATGEKISCRTVLKMFCRTPLAMDRTIVRPLPTQYNVAHFHVLSIIRNHDPTVMGGPCL
jgi:hypothetical protein